MPENSFQFFLGRKNARCVALLEANHEVAATLQSVLEHLVEHCDAKGIPFDKAHVRDVYVSQEGYLSARIV